MDEKIIHRIYRYLDFKGVPATRFEKLVGLSNGYLNTQRKRNADVGESAINKILDYCQDVDPKWLLTGEGEMLRDGFSVIEADRNEGVTQLHYPKSVEKRYEMQEITLYDIKAAANLKTLLVNPNDNIIGQILVPNAPKCDGAITIHGDSMYPLLKSGDIVAYKEVSSVERSNIIFGEIYIVSLNLDGDEYLTIKYVNTSERGDDYIKLVSYNPHHQPMDVPLSNIYAMAIVKLSIRSHMMR